MPTRNIENKLNRTSFASPAVLQTDYAAVALYSTHTKPIQIDGINWGVRSTVPGDYALIAFNDLRVLRGIHVDNNLNLTLAQILALNFEEVYHSNLQGSRNAQYEDFGSEPFTLEPGEEYLVLNGDAALSGATTGTISLFLTVRGRILDTPIEQAKTIPRDGAPVPDIAPSGGNSEQGC